MQPRNFLNKRETLVFKKAIGAGVTDVLSARIKGECTIEGLRIKFYPGQENALQVRAFIEHKGHQIEDLVEYVETGDNYLSGDDDYFIFNLSLSASNDDFIKVQVVNTSASFAYTLQVQVEVDYYGGRNRVVGGVING